MKAYVNMNDELTCPHVSSPRGDHAPSCAINLHNSAVTVHMHELPLPAAVI